MFACDSTGISKRKHQQMSSTLPNRMFIVQAPGVGGEVSLGQHNP